MKEWLKNIEEWSKRNDAVVDRDRYSMGLFVLVLAGLCLQLPLILNVIIQACFLTCTVHLIYRYFKGGYYILALLKIGIIFAVALADNMFYFKIT
ncbi:MAG: hypothetical protein K2L17_10810 [Muribaculaceae bacterium]|nr:hypothetical protein [Muribaculaceae bacterium]